MEKDINVNYDKVHSSIQTMSSINELLNSVDLESYFEEMEKYFREINFEHANCLNYKESFETIYSNIDIIKRKSSELENTLIGIENNNTNSKDNFLKSLAAKINVDELDIKNTIPVQNQVIENNEQSGPGVNTVPIGVAIGTAGVIGSVGAVAINEMYDKNKNKPKKRMEFNDYNVDETFNNDEDYKSMLTEDYFGSATVSFDQNKPYKANRKTRSADMSYFSDGDSSLPDLDDSEDKFS